MIVRGTGDVAEVPVTLAGLDPSLTTLPVSVDSIGSGVGYFLTDQPTATPAANRLVPRVFSVDKPLPLKYFANWLLTTSSNAVVAYNFGSFAPGIALRTKFHWDMVYTTAVNTGFSFCLMVSTTSTAATAITQAGTLGWAAFGGVASTTNYSPYTDYENVATAQATPQLLAGFGGMLTSSATYRFREGDLEFDTPPLAAANYLWLVYCPPDATAGSVNLFVTVQTAKIGC